MILKITSKENFSWPAFGIDLRVDKEKGEEQASVIATLTDDKLMPTLRGLADVGKLTLDEVNSRGEVVRTYDPKRGDFGTTDKSKLDRDEEDDEALQELAEELVADRRKLEADRAALADDQKALAKQKADLDAARVQLEADRAALAASKPAEGSSESSSTGGAEGQPAASGGRRTGTQRGAGG